MCTLRIVRVCSERGGDLGNVISFLRGFRVQYMEEGFWDSGLCRAGLGNNGILLMEL